MKDQYYSELAKLFKKPATFDWWDDVTFVAYSPKEVHSTYSDIFDANRKHREQSKPGGFLKESKELLDLCIGAFDLVIGKAKHPKSPSPKYPHIEQTMKRLHEIKEQLSLLESLDGPLVDAIPTGGPFNLYFSYQISEGNESRDPEVYAAVCDYFRLIYMPYSTPFKIPAPPKRANIGKSEVKKKGSNIFSNYTDIDLSGQFGIPKSLSDGLARVIKHANHESAVSQYRENNRSLSFKAKEAKGETTLSIDESALTSYRAADEFAKQLMKVKDAKILQTFCALWKFACIQNSFQFREVPLSAIMEIALKKNDKTNFSVADRRNFTTAIEHLLRLTITLQAQKQVTGKNGKTRTVLEVERGIRLLRGKSTYALMKEFQNIPKEELDNDIHFDKTVITKFSGELLPDYNQGFTGRSSIYYDALLRMDANKDRKAIVLGFSLQTRFNQNQDKNKPLQYERSYLVDLCDYQKTNSANTTEATKQIHKVLTKLKENNLIGGFDNLTNNGADKVNIFPPTTVQIQSMV